MLPISYPIVRLQEDQLSSVHRAELDSLHSQQQHQTQLLLNDFNKAKQLLTTKLQETEQRSTFKIIAMTNCTISDAYKCCSWLTLSEV